MELNFKKLSFMLHFPKIDPTHYQGILIDLDNTLYPFNPPHKKALQACHTALKTPLSFADFNTLIDQIRSNLAAKSNLQSTCRSRHLIFQMACHTLGLTQPHNWAHQLETLYWTTFLDNMTACPDAIAFVQSAHALQKPICIVTNMQSYWQMKKIQQLGIAPFIHTLICSENIGVEKPSPVIFKAALAAIDCLATKAVMIGDHPQKDIEGASHLGIQAFQVHSA